MSQRFILPVAGLFTVLVACATQSPEPEVQVPEANWAAAAAEPESVTVDDSQDFLYLDNDTELEASMELPVENGALVATSSEAIPAGRFFELRRGETLAHFARWAELPVEDIAQASGLDLSGTYPVGTDVFVALTGEAMSDVESRREQHRTARVDGYLSSRGGSLGSEFHAVRTGDTAWQIARDAHGIPVWLLEAYNPSVDLDRLRPGQELMVPVLADVVVDAGDE